MNNKYYYAFGLEIHAQLLTKTKAFSPSGINVNSKPNMNINHIDFGYPGIKPVVNKKIIQFSYKLANILKMNIANEIVFDRKNYFYPDLSKGYQITQFYKPIATDGIFEISNNKKIKIKQIQIEEDTAQQIHIKNKTLLDFNRAGIPLLEIITDYKDLKTIDEVLDFIKLIRQQLITLEINDGNMHNGSFRIDVNVSISKNKNEYGERVEIKNLNSFSNIKKSLEKEIEEQTHSLEQNKKINLVTKKYDEEKNINITMRNKNTISDYNFIFEGNIIPIRLTKDQEKDFNNQQGFTISDYKNKYLKKCTEEQKEILTSNIFLSNIFLSLKNEIDVNKLVNFITTKIISFFKKEIIYFPYFKFNKEELKLLIELYYEGKIDTNNTNKLLDLLFKNKSILNDLNNFKNTSLIAENKLKNILLNIIKQNPKMMKELKTRPERVEKFLMGQLMKETKGKINPKKAMETIKLTIYE